MPDDKKEVTKGVKEPHGKDHSDMDYEARVQKHSIQKRRLAMWRSQYEDYIRQAKAAITGV